MKPADWEAMSPFERELLDLLRRGVRALETLAKIEEESESR